MQYPERLIETENILESMVVKSNELIQKTSFQLSAQQQKIILLLISKIRPEDDEFKRYEFTVAEFCRACGIQLGGLQYETVWNAVDGLRTAEITYHGRTAIPMGNGWEGSLQWISWCGLNKEKGVIGVELDRHMRPFLLGLKRDFTKYELCWTLHLTRKYSIRLYEYCKSRQYHDLKPYMFTISVDEMRERIGAECYERYSNLWQKALEPSIREINEKTDLNIEMEPVKSGKTVKRLKVTVSHKGQFEVLPMYADLEESLGAV